MGERASVAAPRFAASRPRLPVPAGACDCHVHVFGPAARYRFVSERSYTPPSALPQDAVRMLDRLGVDRAVIVQPTPYGTDNRRLLAALSEIGKEARGIAAVGADVAVGELRRLDLAGVRGVRLHSRIDGLGGVLDKMRALSKPAAELGWHFDLHVDADALSALADSVPAHAAIVLDHFGGLGTASGSAMRPLMRLLDSGRCWIKLSAPYRLLKDGASFADLAALVDALVRASPERLLWGSDWPHTPPHAAPGEDASEVRPFRQIDTGSLLDSLMRAVADEAVRRLVLVGNPAELYGFGRPQAHGD